MAGNLGLRWRPLRSQINHGGRNLGVRKPGARVRGVHRGGALAERNEVDLRWRVRLRVARCTGMHRDAVVMWKKRTTMYRDAVVMYNTYLYIFIILPP